jgi:hypothetical protein
MINSWFSLKDDKNANECVGVWVSSGWTYVGKHINAKQELEYLFQALDGTSISLQLKNDAHNKYKSLNITFT